MQLWSPNTGYPEEVWQPIIRMGGDTGYYFGNYLWRLRGWIDRFLGGIGFEAGGAILQNLEWEMPWIFGGFWR
jgi:hypothetical protein